MQMIYNKLPSVHMLNTDTQSLKMIFSFFLWGKHETAMYNKA